jgi:hypothetical protein
MKPARADRDPQIFNGEKSNKSSTFSDEFSNVLVRKKGHTWIHEKRYDKI